MPLRKITKHICKQKPFDWLAIVVLASFGFIVANIVDSDIKKFNNEMDIEAKGLQADLLFIKTLRETKN